MLLLHEFRDQKVTLVPKRWVFFGDDVSKAPEEQPEIGQEELDGMDTSTLEQYLGDKKKALLNRSLVAHKLFEKAMQPDAAQVRPQVLLTLEKVLQEIDKEFETSSSIASEIGITMGTAMIPGLNVLQAIRMGRRAVEGFTMTELEKEQVARYETLQASNRKLLETVMRELNRGTSEYLRLCSKETSATVQRVGKEFFDDISKAIQGFNMGNPIDSVFNLLGSFTGAKFGAVLDSFGNFGMLLRKWFGWDVGYRGAEITSKEREDENAKNYQAESTKGAFTSLKEIGKDTDKNRIKIKYSGAGGLDVELQISLDESKAYRTADGKVTEVREGLPPLVDFLKTNTSHFNTLVTDLCENVPDKKQTLYISLLKFQKEESQKNKPVNLVHMLAAKWSAFKEEKLYKEQGADKIFTLLTSGASLKDNRVLQAVRKMAIVPVATIVVRALSPEGQPPPSRPNKPERSTTPDRLTNDFIKNSYISPYIQDIKNNSGLFSGPQFYLVNEASEGRNQDQPKLEKIEKGWKIKNNGKEMEIQVTEEGCELIYGNNVSWKFIKDLESLAFYYAALINRIVGRLASNRYGRIYFDEDNKTLRQEIDYARDVVLHVFNFPVYQGDRDMLETIMNILRPRKT